MQTGILKRAALVVGLLTSSTACAWNLSAHFCSALLQCISAGGGGLWSGDSSSITAQSNVWS